MKADLMEEILKKKISQDIRFSNKDNIHTQKSEIFSKFDEHGFQDNTKHTSDIRIGKLLF